MKKYKFEFIVLIVNAIYMILELIASRLLSPYFGNTTIVWTSVIGIILLSSSIGNYIGGIIADKEKLQKAIKLILLTSGFTVLVIPLIQSSVLDFMVENIDNIKIGAILSTLILFFVPSMLIGFLSPIVIKLKIDDLKNAGKVSGKVSAIATLGCILGDFIGGFYLIPHFGGNAILYVLAIILFLLTLFVQEFKLKNFILPISFSLLCGILSFSYSLYNEECGKRVLAGERGVKVTYDTSYGRATIYNNESHEIRNFHMDRALESATYIDKENRYELVAPYTNFYNLIFQSKNEITDTLMIGGGGFSYPKYYISKYANKNMDVIEIDKKVIELAKEYFYLNDLIKEFDLENSKRLNIIKEDGRVYLNKCKKKYDAILNDAFAGENPVKTLTTLEAAQRIYSLLNTNGMYLTNIIASLEGNNSKFLKSEVMTLKQVFKNVYVVPCNSSEDYDMMQNCMVVATDQNLELRYAVLLDTDNAIILTDDYCPIENLVESL